MNLSAMIASDDDFLDLLRSSWGLSSSDPHQITLSKKQMELMWPLLPQLSTMEM